MDDFNPKIVRVYNSVKDNIWIGDIKYAIELLRKLRRAREYREYLSEESRWKEISASLELKLKSVDKSKRHHQETTEIREILEKQGLESEKIILGSVIEELQKIEAVLSEIEKILSQKTLQDLTPQLPEVPGKPGFFKYTILTRSQREFEVRALVYVETKREHLENLVETMRENGFLASDYEIEGYGFSIQFYSDLGHIDVSGVFPRILIQFSLRKPAKEHEIKSYAENILSAVTSSRS